MNHVERWMDDEKLQYRVERKAPKSVYLRFGRFSRTGERSMNHATGEYERGISVYRGILSDGVVTLIDDPNLHLTPEESAELLRDRLVFAVTGREHSERGSDGEPLLIGIRLVSYPIDYTSISSRISEVRK